MKENIRRFLLKPVVIAVITIVLISGTVVAGKGYFGNNNDVQVDNQIVLGKQVKIKPIDFSKMNENNINTVGEVRAERQVDVIALGRGTVRSLLFEVGDKVNLNQSLVYLHNSSALTSHSNSQMTYLNLQNSFDTTKRIAEENVRQVDLSVQNALESVKLAEIAIETVNDNLLNAKNLQENNLNNIKDNAVISFYNYLNTANNVLDQVNYIIKAEPGIQLDGIADTLSAKNTQSLGIAKNNYNLARNNYDSLAMASPGRDTIEAEIKNIVSLLSQVKLAVDGTVDVLDNTIFSSNFSESSLNAQRNSFAALRSQIVSTQNSAEALGQSFDQVRLANIQELDMLSNAIESSEKNLELVQLGYKNALSNSNSVREGSDQQIISSKISLDSALGQFNLSGNQLSDLNIKAPISGLVTAKFVELGSEVSPGQKIAEISQTEKMKIEINLSSDDIYRIQKGQKVKINNDLDGVISLINPAADPVTKKVRVEILYDNQDNRLIQGTFVNVAIVAKAMAKSFPGSVFVPIKAVVISQNESYIFINNDLQAKKVLVTTGKTEGNLIEVLSGIQEGNELIVEGNRYLEDGDKLIIK